MQLRFDTALTGKAYVTEQAWRTAKLSRCPLHRQGSCSFARHGTYARKTPAGTRIPRWYCPQGHRTFSLLPDFLASRLPGTLQTLERVVLAVERCSSIEAAANAVRADDVTLASAIRWIRRRVTAVHVVLTDARCRFPQYFGDTPPSLAGLREQLAVDSVLLYLRKAIGPHLRASPAPVGFARRRVDHGGDGCSPYRHRKGPDPPTKLR